jgi:hypothetical protein
LDPIVADFTSKFHQRVAGKAGSRSLWRGLHGDLPSNVLQQLSENGFGIYALAAFCLA